VTTIAATCVATPIRSSTSGSGGLSRRSPRATSPTSSPWLCDEHEQGRRLADATVRRIFAPVRSCLATAVREWVIRHNPATGAALPHRPDVDDDEEEVRVLTSEQLTTFLGLVNPRHRTFFRFLALTGLRWGEATALRWKDLRLDGTRPVVKVRRAIYKGRVEPPKTKYGKRDVPLNAALVSELRERRKVTEWPSDDFVFPSEVGTPMRSENVRRRVLAPVAEEAGAPWAGFHTHRRTCASMLFERGKNAKQVQRWLGHHSASFTLDRYIHLFDEDGGEPLDLPQGGNKVVTDGDGLERTQGEGEADVFPS
jgi:integrase